ncbi:hypothetical protein AR687_19720 [Flavobacteriaceae bacterium CRH]|nr:hypothetical protein AR687_19720 [Flavobacteriaceae bacterium CRH]
MKINYQSDAGQGMGVAALILGIVGGIAAFLPCLGFVAVIMGVLSIVFGAIGISQAKKENASTTMPIAGLLVGIATTVFIFIWLVVTLGILGVAMLSHKDEISNAIDSLKVQTEKIQKHDSLNNDAEIVIDSVITAEESK